MKAERNKIDMKYALIENNNYNEGKYSNIFQRY